MRKKCLTNAGGLVVAATGSGVGKTSFVCGLLRALRRRKWSAQPFKVGPDYIDPGYLSAAASIPCLNLDPWMSSAAYVRSVVARSAGQGRLPVIEGVMGLHDGASPRDRDGSTAHVAALLGLPIVLVVNANGLSRSFAALVKGFVEFDRELRFLGVVANQVGSQNHLRWLEESTRVSGLPRLLGGIARDALPLLPKRHLGLVDASENSAEIFELLADAVEESVDVDFLVKELFLPKASASVSVQVPGTVEEKARDTVFLRSVGRSRDSRIRVGVARDQAFRFTYADNLKALEEAGAELCFFSPLADSRLPLDLGGVYLPGGYPELSAAQLSANHSMSASVRSFAENGGLIYAECGGLIYLGLSVTGVDGQKYVMTGVLPIATAMLSRRSRLAYVQAAFVGDCCWGKSGTVLRGHEFHYSEIIQEPPSDSGARPLYRIRDSRGERVAGYILNNVVAGYPHLHWADHPAACRAFVETCAQARQKQSS